MLTIYIHVYVAILHEGSPTMLKHLSSYVTCVSGCFGDVKAEGASLLTPSFIIFLPLYRLNEEKALGKRKIVRDEKKH